MKTLNKAYYVTDTKIQLIKRTYESSQTLLLVISGP